jgi:hypothetical protein
MAREARRIFIEYGFDKEGGSEHAYNILKEMEEGHPEKAIDRIQDAVYICRDIAQSYLEDGPEGEKRDVEASYERQAEFMNMETFVRATKKEYGIPIETTSALRRNIRGKRELRILKKPKGGREH